jgi:pachytene checkpoint protein 2
MLTNADGMKHEGYVMCAEVANYTGPADACVLHALADVDLDVKSYMLRPEYRPGDRSRAKHLNEDQTSHVRMLYLPNQSLHEAWTSLVFEDALPGRLLRQLVRTIDLMSQPGLNLSVFNWNRLCLLHGPPGSGKSTLCRALAQKLSIQLGDSFGKAVLIEINTNSMLSKYFSESGKQIDSTFDHIYGVCQDRKKLVCVVMDEVETIAGSRGRVVEGTECGDGLRVRQSIRAEGVLIAHRCVTGDEPTSPCARSYSRSPKCYCALHQQSYRGNRECLSSLSNLIAS